MLTILAQVVALPLAGSALGPEKFGALFALSALASFACIGAQGFSPAASYAMARSLGAGDEGRAAGEFWAVALLSCASGFLVLTLGLAGSLMVAPGLVVGHDVAFTAELQWGLLAAALQVACFYWFWFAEGVRAAYQENYITNVYATIASGAALILTAIAYGVHASIGTFYMTLFATPSLAQGLSLAHLMVRRRSELGRPKTTNSLVRDVAHRALNYSRAQVGNNLYLQGSVYITVHSVGLPAGAVAGATVRLFVLLHSVFLSFLTPVLPTLSYGKAAGDMSWVVRAARMTLIASIAAPLVIATVIAGAGKWIFAIWLKLPFPQFSFDAALIGAMGAAFMAAHLSYMALTAIDDPKWGSKRIMAAGVVSAGAAVLVSRTHDMALMFGAQALVMLCLATLPLLVRLYRQTEALEAKTLPLA
jgi:O-antigen/teichoic acid export membrane protein